MLPQCEFINKEGPWHALWQVPWVTDAVALEDILDDYWLTVTKCQSWQILNLSWLEKILTSPKSWTRIFFKKQNSPTNVVVPCCSQIPNGEKKSTQAAAISCNQHFKCFQFRTSSSHHHCYCYLKQIIIIIITNIMLSSIPNNVRGQFSS